MRSRGCHGRLDTTGQRGSQPVTRLAQAVEAETGDAAPTRRLDECTPVGVREAIGQQSHVEEPHQAVVSLVVRQAMDAANSEAVDSSWHVCGRAEAWGRPCVLPQLVEGQRVGEDLRVDDLPMQVDHMVNAVRVESFERNLMADQRAGRHRIATGVPAAFQCPRGLGHVL